LGDFFIITANKRELGYQPFGCTHEINRAKSLFCPISLYSGCRLLAEEPQAINAFYRRKKLFGYKTVHDNIIIIIIIIRVYTVCRRPYASSARQHYTERGARYILSVRPSVCHSGG